MIMEMVDSEPPFFNEPPLMAMKKIRDQAPPILKDPDKVKISSHNDLRGLVPPKQNRKISLPPEMSPPP